MRLTGKMREGKADLFVRAGTGDYTVRWKNFIIRKMDRQKQAVYHGMPQGVSLADQIQLPRVDGKELPYDIFSRCGWITRKYSAGGRVFQGNVTRLPEPDFRAGISVCKKENQRASDSADIAGGKACTAGAGTFGVKKKEKYVHDLYVKMYDMTS